jgi:hypothetical protein
MLKRIGSRWDALGILRFLTVLFGCFALAALSSCQSHPKPKQKKEKIAREGHEQEEEWPIQNSGGDVPAPYRSSRQAESEQQISTPSTPTPTPNRPIDRPLDPTGLPVGAPTP